MNDYNSIRNHKTQFPVIADPAEAELNQGWLAYSGLPDTTIKGGRQKIIYNNHRFVGNVGWRQMEQTFDAVSILNQTIGNSDLKLAFVWNVRTVISKSVSVASPLLNLGYTFQDIGKLTVYSYLLDYSDAGNRKDRGTLCCESYYVVCFERGEGVVPRLSRPRIDKSVPRLTPPLKETSP